MSPEEISRLFRPVQVLTEQMNLFNKTLDRYEDRQCSLRSRHYQKNSYSIPERHDYRQHYPRRRVVPLPPKLNPDGYTSYQGETKPRPTLRTFAARQESVGKGEESKRPTKEGEEIPSPREPALPQTGHLEGMVEPMDKGNGYELTSLSIPGSEERLGDVKVTTEPGEEVPLCKKITTLNNDENLTQVGETVIKGPSLNNVVSSGVSSYQLIVSTTHQVSGSENSQSSEYGSLSTKDTEAWVTPFQVPSAENGVKVEISIVIVSTSVTTTVIMATPYPPSTNPSSRPRYLETPFDPGITGIQ